MSNSLEIDIRLQRDRFTLEVIESILLAGITAVFGASGSGKTSLLRIIAGLEPKVSGSIRFRDCSWLNQHNHVATEKRRVGYVFQDGRLFGHLDVLGNLEFARRGAGTRTAISLDETVSEFALSDLLNRDTRTLSNGERQRVAIGRSLLAAPELLLMDEPLSSLDRASKAELLPLIQSLPARFGLPVIYVTHDISELARLADSVLLLAKGRCHANGSPREVMKRDDFIHLANLESEMCLLETRVIGQEGELTVTEIAGQQLRVAELNASPGDRARLLISPGDVILATARPTGISIRNCLSGQLTGLRPSGSGQCTAEIALADQQLTALVTEDAVSDLGLRPGNTVHALIKTVAIGAFGVPTQKP